MAFTGTVRAIVETPTVAGSGDVADDPAIWVDRSNPANSVIIGTDKDGSQGGLYVYDMQGRQVDHFSAGGALNNVDLRYGFTLGGSKIDLIGATNRKSDTIDFFKIDGQSHELTKIGSVASGQSDPYGFTMGISEGKYYAFVSNNGSGKINQIELDGSSGSIKGTIVRTLDLGGTVEGMTVDDEKGALYAGRESAGVYKYGLTPDSGSSRTTIDTTGGGHLTADVEGMGIYDGPNGSGYLVVSSQGSSSYTVYDRNDNTYLGTFKVGANGSIDGATSTDGIEVSSANLGGAFGAGAFITHDASNSGGSTSNYKFVPWTDLQKLIGDTAPPDNPVPVDPTPTDPTPADPTLPSDESPTFNGTSYTGSDSDEIIVGNDSDNAIRGRYGDDTIMGGNGDDGIDGGVGNDVLHGGAGEDVFIFGTSALTNEQILDFVQGQDKIDLSRADANKAASGNQSFAFIGAEDFSGLGQVHSWQDTARGVTIIEGNSAGSLSPDIHIEVKGLHTLLKTDFIL